MKTIRRLTTLPTSLPIAVAFQLLMLAGSPGNLLAQPATSDFSIPLDPMRTNCTYQGQISFSFPNFTFYSNNAPLHVANPTQGAGSRVVFRSPSGMSWDGMTFFAHPAYHQSIVNRHRLASRPIGTNTTQPSARKATQPPQMQPRLRSAGSPKDLPLPSKQSRVNPPIVFEPSSWVVAPPATQTSRLDHSGSPQENISPGPSFVPTYGPPPRAASFSASSYRPGYCGSPNAISTAIKPLTVCQP